MAKDIHTCDCCTRNFPFAKLERDGMRKVKVGAEELIFCPYCYLNFTSILHKTFLAGYEKGCGIEFHKPEDGNKAYQSWRLEVAAEAYKK